jgi:alpha-tubulin suppressor-like RCC1 family protein
MRRWLLVTLLLTGCSARDLCGLQGTCDGTTSDAGADATSDGGFEAGDGGVCPQATTRVSDAVRIAAGDLATCAVRANGAVLCWGGNASALVDPGSTASFPTPKTILGQDAVDVSVGTTVACARVKDGRLFCWGPNQANQLGREPYGVFEGQGPGVVVDDKKAPFVVGGAFGCAHWHSCAIGTNGSVACWGLNNGGACGADPATNLNLKAPGIANAATSSTSALAVGKAHGCATVGSAIQCWGGGNEGQLGSPISAQCPDSYLCSPTPLAVPLAPGATAPFGALTAGDDFTCALDAKGKVFCWGGTTLGQTGDTSFAKTNQPDPKAPHVVTGLPLPARAIAAGAVTACAVLEDGSVWCWGANEYGQLGRGAPDPADAGAVPHVDPQAVAGISGAKAVAIGDGHACALVGCGAGAQIACWGRNAEGQLGSGQAGAPSGPVFVVAP